MGNCDSCASPRLRAPTSSTNTFEDYISTLSTIKSERSPLSNEMDQLDENGESTQIGNRVNYRIVPVGRKPSAKSIHLPQPTADKIKKHLGI
jgi:hypothetical protein